MHATNAKFTTRHKAQCVGTSVGAVHTFLIRHKKLRIISARRKPNPLTDQTLARVRIAKQLLTKFPKYISQAFENIITW